MTLLDAIADPGGRQLVLASASPRRSDLLRSVGVDFEVIPADIDESAHPGETPSEYVARLSARKAAVVAAGAGRGVVVIAGDTTVDVDGQILEKPVDDADARRMLTLLSGRGHLVHTGVTVQCVGAAPVTEVVETVVHFAPLTDAMITWYLATGEAAGKAGAYGMQGAAGAFVERIEGSTTNVIGLPLAETLAMLATALRIPVENDR